MWNKLTDREQFVYDMRENGATYKKIAETIGVCIQTAARIYRKAERKKDFYNKMGMYDDLDDMIYKALNDRVSLRIRLEIKRLLCQNEIRSINAFNNLNIEELIENSEVDAVKADALRYLKTISEKDDVKE